MKAVFVESSDFTDSVVRLLPDDAYAQLQQELMDDPNKGNVIPGCGGLRKVRTSNPKRGKGKRGGLRVIYLYIPETKWFFMLDIYGKDEHADLTADEKKALSKLATELKRQAKLSVRSDETRRGSRKPK